jgi:hypothetical protein
VAALLVVAAFTVFGTRQNVAAEYGAASAPLHLQGAAVSETTARFQWLAGEGNLWFCVDVADTADDLENLKGSWFNSGCGTTGTTHLVKGLECSRTYYARVWALTDDGGMYSPELKFDMNECATTITAPVNLRPLFSTAHTVRLAWDAGDNNIWYCVQMATDQSELLAYGESWGSYGCGNMETELTLGDLSCETVYYWRVAAWNYRTDTVSEVRTAITGDCDGKQRIAPIRSVDVDRVGDEYQVEVVIELPNGCHSAGSFGVERDGTRIDIRLRNTYIAPLTVCANLVGKHVWTITLGNDFSEGQTYEVVVNEEKSAFFTFEPPYEGN